MTHFLGYCPWCSKVNEIRASSETNTHCPECGAINPRSIDSLPDHVIARLVEEEQLSHDDLVTAGVA